jgi:hypothetical protein
MVSTVAVLGDHPGRFVAGHGEQGQVTGVNTLGQLAPRAVKPGAKGSRQRAERPHEEAIAGQGPFALGRVLPGDGRTVGGLLRPVIVQTLPRPSPADPSALDTLRRQLTRVSSS